MNLEPAERAAAFAEEKMPDSYTNLLYHIIYSTKDRRPLITNDLESQLHEYDER